MAHRLSPPKIAFCDRGERRDQILYHANHIHLDLVERARGYRTCQWDVEGPKAVADVPTPLPKPEALAERNAPKPPVETGTRKRPHRSLSK